ncbi:hypothetical protein [Candidatus Uabimicrobium amorphum]|uniref:Uncharacterized protein n=1 Tax=Uabimicrobium amorphum TaxID=2596890 RepID=A0A5S9F3C1_UABAM|nr:hypothetical protein [Candidatus Uabimicrobium amorphum]BBM84577.1 hypothetical protein UABAM_02938 [Candidatus Uabimicrobium amorphum]
MQELKQEEHEGFNFDFWTRVSMPVVAATGYFLGSYIGNQMYPKDVVKEVSVAFIVCCVLLVMNFMGWKIAEKCAKG